MIYCPKCSAANREGSKFCNDCGAKLPSASGLRCPMCGKINALGNVYCDACNARLVPLTAQAPTKESPPTEAAVPIKRGLSLPTKPRDEEAQAPDWLSQMRAAQSAPGEPESAPPAEDLEPTVEAPDWARLEEPPAAQEAPDWLRDLRKTAIKKPIKPEPAAAPIEPQPEEQVPDWLRKVAPPAAEIPDWLQGMAPAAEPAKPIPAEPAAEIPDWLRGMAPAAEPTKPIPAEPAAEVPDWLREAAPPAAEPAAEVPDWLREAAPPAAEPAAAVPDWLREAAPPAAEPAAAVPDWLRELAPPAEPAGPTPVAPQPEMPDWMSDLGQMAAPAAAAATPALTPAELPDWLQQMAPPPSAPPPVEETIPSLTPLAPGELPDWLREMKAAAPPGQPTPAGMPPAVEGLAQATIPAWLEALRPKELAPAGPAMPVEEVSTEETEGILAGLRDALPLAAVAGQALGRGVSLKFDVPAGDLSRAGIFNEVLTRGVGAVVRRGEVRSPWRGRVQRWVVFSIIGLAVLAPYLLQAFTPQAPALRAFVSAFVGQPVPSPASRSCQARIDQLPASAPVLVAFDYDPSQAEEMNAIARPILAHLLERKARLIAVSLYPVGPATAQAILTQTVQAAAGGEAPFVNLGYVPGQALGAHLVASWKFGQVMRTDFSGRPLTGETGAAAAMLRHVKSIQDVKLIVELAATPESVQWWIEQLAARPDAPPLVAGVSAAAAPMVRPYLTSARAAQPDTPQLAGLVNGLPDGLAYRSASIQDDSPAGAFESLSLASLALIILIVIGNVLQRAAQLRRR